MLILTLTCVRKRIECKNILNVHPAMKVRFTQINVCRGLGEMESDFEEKGKKIVSRRSMQRCPFSPFDQIYQYSTSNSVPPKTVPLLQTISRNRNKMYMWYFLAFIGRCFVDEFLQLNNLF